MLNYRNNISSSLPLRSAGQEAVNLPIKKLRVNRDLRDLKSLILPQSGHYCSQAETENTYVGRAEFYYKFIYIYWNVYSPYFPLSRNIFHLLTFPNHRKIKTKIFSAVGPIGLCTRKVVCWFGLEVECSFPAPTWEQFSYVCVSTGKENT